MTSYSRNKFIREMEILSPELLERNQFMQSPVQKDLMIHVKWKISWSILELLTKKKLRLC